MRRIRLFVTIGLFLGIFLPLKSIAAPSGTNHLIFHGIGYPPVKAENKAQALLMARRAAILDAYRNAIRSRFDSTVSNSEGSYYERLDGFVKGMTIVAEEYLEDGGIKITASVPEVSIFVPPKSEYSKKKTGGSAPSRRLGPVTVTIKEWFKIIEKVVTFGSNSLVRGDK